MPFRRRLGRSLMGSSSKTDKTPEQIALEFEPSPELIKERYEAAARICQDEIEIPFLGERYIFFCHLDKEHHNPHCGLTGGHMCEWWDYMSLQNLPDRDDIVKRGTEDSGGVRDYHIWKVDHRDESV